MKQYKITIDDIQKNYFHFTWQSNLDSIKEKGLTPRKGNHAKYIEETNKVFFVEGLDNLLILFDCWINVYKRIPIFKDTNPIYKVCSYLMRSKYFPSFFVDLYFKLTKNLKYHKKKSYKIFDDLINNCILLNLNIKEDIDFSKQDIDEIKSRGFKKRHLIELGYSEKYSDMNSNKMDNWNLHTYSNHGITPNKIKLCYIDDSYLIKDLLLFILKNTTINLEELCPVLCDYLKSRNIKY